MSRVPTLAEVERQHILDTLARCGNNRTHAAKALGLSIRSLRIKLNQYQHAGFDVPPIRTGRERQDEAGR